MTTMMIIDLASIWSFKLYQREEGALEYHWTWSVVEELLLQKGWNSETEITRHVSVNRDHTSYYGMSQFKKWNIKMKFEKMNVKLYNLPLIINIILAFLISPHKCKIEIKLNTMGCGVVLDFSQKKRTWSKKCKNNSSRPYLLSILGMMKMEWELAFVMAKHFYQKIYFLYYCLFASRIESW